MSPLQMTRLWYYPEDQCLLQKLLLETDLWCLWLNSIAELIVRSIKKESEIVFFKETVFAVENGKKEGFNGSDRMGSPNYGKEGHFRHFLPSRFNDSVEESYVLDSCLQFFSYFIPSAGFTEREICLFFHGSQVAFVLLTINHPKIKDQI